MQDLESLSHSRWECKYHVVFIPKCRRQALYKELTAASRGGVPELGVAEAEPNRRRHLLADHVHMLISIPPKHAVAHVVGYLKGKSAIHIARTFLGRRQNFAGQHFWARGYYVSTVGRDEETIRAYIKRQEQEDQRLDQMGLWP